MSPNQPGTLAAMSHRAYLYNVRSGVTMSQLLTAMQSCQVFKEESDIKLIQTPGFIMLRHAVYLVVILGTKV